MASVALYSAESLKESLQYDITDNGCHEGLFSHILQFVSDNDITELFSAALLTSLLWFYNSIA